MKRLVMFFSLLMVLGVAALAHEGAVCLYKDVALSACSATIMPMGTVDIALLYIKGDGVDMGAAAQFRIILTTSGATISNVIWNPYITLFEGTPPGNVSIAGQTNFGCGLDIVWLGTLTVWNLMDSDTFYVKVVDNPDVFWGPGIYITDCEPEKNEIKVIGGTFVFNGSCNVAIEPKSWGAIKSMYR
jgi:hypothetical protein